MMNKKWWASVIRFEISVDDGCKLDAKIARLCQKYDIPCTFYIPIDYITLAINKGYEPLPQASYRWLIDNFEIGSHGVTHRYLTQINTAEAKDEVFASKQMMENMIGRPVTKFCYPRGRHNQDIKDYVKQAGYKSARSTVIGHIGKQEDIYARKTAVHMGCPVRPEYEGTTWLDYGIKMLNKAKTLNKKIDGDVEFEMWMHSWEVQKYGEWENVKKFLKIISQEHKKGIYFV